MINFPDLSRETMNKIDKINIRAAKMAEKLGYPFDFVSRSMDIQAVAETINLDVLLGFDDSNFAHDVFGIYKHLNRSTLELEDCFSPRSEKCYHEIK